MRTLLVIVLASLLAGMCGCGDPDSPPPSTGKGSNLCKELPACPPDLPYIFPE